MRRALLFSLLWLALPACSWSFSKDLRYSPTVATSTPKPLGIADVSDWNPATAVPTVSPPTANPTLAPAQHTTGNTALAVNVASAPTAVPVITTFSTTANSADESELLQRSARIPVTWSVTNRPDNATLVFEQLMPDGSAVNVELPRDNPWVPSSGNGVVAPSLPWHGDPVQIRVRLVRQSDGATLTSRELSVPVTRSGQWQAADPAACIRPPYSPAADLRIGVYGMVRTDMPDRGLELWDVPAPVHQLIGTLKPGEKFTTLEGPYCYLYPWPSDGPPYMRLWRVRSSVSALEGWIGEYSIGIPDGLSYNVELYPEGVVLAYFYDPAFCDTTTSFLPKIGLVVGGEARVTISPSSPRLSHGLPVVDDPAGYVGQEDGKDYLQPGEIVTVLDGPFCFRPSGYSSGQNTFRQWKVRSESRGVEGWTTEYWYSLMSSEEGYYLQPVDSSTTAAATFSASPDPVAHGGTLTLSWDVPGATSISITRLSETGGIYLESISGQRPASGSLTYTIPDDYVEQIPFVLLANNLAQPTLTVSITCPFEQHLVDVCPQSQQTFQAVYQPFENGTMIWRSDARKIYVLFNNPSQTFEVYPDTWVEGETFDVGETPPAGRMQPVRGFGKVWATGNSPQSWVNPPGVRERLGWALAPEASYTMTLEVHPRVWNRPDVLFLTLPDGKIICLNFESILSWQIVN